MGHRYRDGDKLALLAGGGLAARIDRDLEKRDGGG
jgi:hypothetical protein